MHKQQEPLSTTKKQLQERIYICSTANITLFYLCLIAHKVQHHRNSAAEALKFFFNNSLHSSSQLKKKKGENKYMHNYICLCCEYISYTYILTKAAVRRSQKSLTTHRCNELTEAHTIGSLYV